MGGDKLVLVDVGAEGGLQEKWQHLAFDLHPIFVEPSPASAAALRSGWPCSTVLEVGLLDRPCVRTLNITRLSGCSSLLEPNTELLKRWRVAPAFDVVRTVEIQCERYDTLHRSGTAPTPDVIKVDVQGVEFEVLSGFGDLLHQCLGVELEAHFYPIYRGERLLYELIRLLAGYGLALRRLSPVMNFDGDLVEVDAYFTRSLPGDADPRQKAKLSLIEEVWGVYTDENGAALARMAGMERPVSEVSLLSV